MQPMAFPEVQTYVAEENAQSGMLNGQRAAGWVFRDRPWAAALRRSRGDRGSDGHQQVDFGKGYQRMW